MARAPEYERMLNSMRAFFRLIGRSSEGAHVVELDGVMASVCPKVPERSLPNSVDYESQPARAPDVGAPAGITRAVADWLVPLPRGAEPPYEVWVNGVAQEEGVDYTVTEGGLAFRKPLEKERIGMGRWAAIFFGLWGSYGKNDSVDVRYTFHGERRLAHRLDIVPPPVP